MGERSIVYRDLLECLRAAATLANGELSGDELALRTRRSYTAVRLHGRANTVLDVTKANALTEFARVLRRFRTPHGLKALARVAGVRYKSARGPGTNLVLFPQRFEDTESWCALQDEAGPSLEFARIDGGNWCELC
jgi:hypothetical protein